MKSYKILGLIFISALILNGTCYARATVENLAQVEKLFMEGKYERVIKEAGGLIDSGAGGREELFYLKGLSQIQLNEFRDARETLHYMIERYPRGKRAFDGYLGVGDAFFLENKVPEAIASYNEALANFPDHKNAPTVYYKIGAAYRRLGAEDKAREYLDKVKQSSPLSFESRMTPEAPQAIPETAAPAAAKHEYQHQVPGAGSYYYVQAGYFKSRANAEKLSAQLKAKGYDSHVEKETRTGFNFYRVKVGRFELKAEAENMAMKLKSDGYKNKVCR